MNNPLQHHSCKETLPISLYSKSFRGCLLVLTAHRPETTHSELGFSILQAVCCCSSAAPLNLFTCCNFGILLAQHPSSLCTPAHIEIRPQSSVLAADRYEAEQLPQTVTSHIDPRAFDAQRTDYVPVQDEGSLTAAECIPSQQWLTEFLADFAGLRSQLHRSLAIIAFICTYHGTVGHESILHRTCQVNKHCCIATYIGPMQKHAFSLMPEMHHSLHLCVVVGSNLASL